MLELLKLLDASTLHEKQTSTRSSSTLQPGNHHCLPTSPNGLPFPAGRWTIIACSPWCTEPYSGHIPANFKIVFNFSLPTSLRCALSPTGRWTIIACSPWRTEPYTCHIHATVSSLCTFPRRSLDHRARHRGRCERRQGARAQLRRRLLDAGEHRRVGRGAGHRGAAQHSASGAEPRLAHLPCVPQFYEPQYCYTSCSSATLGPLTVNARRTLRFLELLPTLERKCPLENVPKKKTSGRFRKVSILPEPT